MDKSTVDYGKELEALVSLKFQELGYPNAKRSNGSGNKGQHGDIQGQDIMIVECKNRNTQDITLKEEVWNKLVAELPLHSQRLPMYILGNKNKKVWCVLDIDTMFEILSVWKENK